MSVDSYRWLPVSFAETYKKWPLERGEPLPWTALPGPMSELKLGLVTTAGIYVEGREPPFDTDRERREPVWGDPSYRTVPRTVARQGIGTSHLHVNNEPVAQDLNVALPLDPAEEALAAGGIGGLADTHYSVMGYQLDTTSWESHACPEIAEGLRAQGVDLVLLTPY